MEAECPGHLHCPCPWRRIYVAQGPCLVPSVANFFSQHPFLLPIPPSLAVTARLTAPQYIPHLTCSFLNLVMAP